MGLKFERVFTTAIHPFEKVGWTKRNAVITGAKGKEVFRQDDVEFPDFYSDTAVNIIASKYFAMVDGRRENSLRQLICRVVDTTTHWAEVSGILTDNNWITFKDELTHILLHQMAAFNSPVWFNLGVPNRRQAVSACYIQSIDDNMESIRDLYQSESILFGDGSGSGSNFSKLRGNGERLSSGGSSSGPLAFIQGLDAASGAIKSGGKTRRAAKMVVLNVDHPDIEDFIATKVKAEDMAAALISSGFSAEFNDPNSVYASLPFQNANNSVRVTDDFMSAVEHDQVWELKGRVDATVNKTVRAGDIWAKIAGAAWRCGDPGLQFDTHINEMHTCPNDGRINSSNPCCFVGETMVDTSEGRIRIDQLVKMFDTGEKLPMAFGFDKETELPVMKQISRAWLAGNTTKLVRITTDKGTVLLCTPEHKILLKSGSYIEAQKLNVGNRLRKIGRWANSARSNRFALNHRETDTTSNGTVIQARFMWEQAYGEIPKGYDVHHLNGNATDDRLSNLDLIQEVEHVKEHSTGSNNPRYLETSKELLVSVWESLEGKRPVTIGRWNNYVHRRNLKGVVPLANSRGIRGQSWSEFGNWIEQNRSLTNDSVKTIEFIDCEPTPVYDLEVPGTNNFAVGETTHTIVVSNSEYMFLDDSACNLASINLMRMVDNTGTFRYDWYEQVIRVMITAMESFVGNADYPTDKIKENSHKFRPLGLGYANLGALLMYMGLPYDSETGRALAAKLTSFMGAKAYHQSAELAYVLGPFDGYERNKESMLNVIAQHLKNEQQLGLAESEWGSALTMGELHGYRNSQVTVLAPTGTIGFMMDCDTTGIEPCLSLVAYKKMVGGGNMKLVNNGVVNALVHLGYPDNIVDETIEAIYKGKPFTVKDQAVFDCALPDAMGRSIAPMGHVKMMSAVQPFLSGAISKTVNMPATATIADIAEIYLQSWKMNLKAVAVYRDGCKSSQPMSSKETKTEPTPVTETQKRRKLPDSRNAITHKFEVGGHQGYLHVGLYDDGTPGEVFITMAKEGSTISGLMDSFAIMTSMALQYGMPLSALIEKLAHTSFEPSGWNKELGRVSSITDYVARWLASRFESVSATPAMPLEKTLKVNQPLTIKGEVNPLCINCGSVTVRSGSCYCCNTCGTTSGCS